MSSGWTPGEKERLLGALAAGREAPACPRCDARLERREVPPREDVAYVRDRILLVCGGCGASGALDRREVERRRERRGSPGDRDARQPDPGAEDGQG